LRHGKATQKDNARDALPKLCSNDAPRRCSTALLPRWTRHWAFATRFRYGQMADALQRCAGVIYEAQHKDKEDQ
jgi:hypothetical protein